MKRAITFLLFTLFVMSMSAYDFKSGNFYYNITSSNTVEVTSGDTKYSGNVVIPSSVTYNDITYNVTSIGEWAFSDCSSLASVTIGNSVTSIGENAFYNCSLLNGIDIPNGVTRIGSNAFSNCTSLTFIKIPESVVVIENFDGYPSHNNIALSTPNLKSIIVDPDNPVYDSREGCNAVIETATNKLIFGCQNTFIPNSVASIGYVAFYDCTTLTSIDIPSTVKSIREGAFHNTGIDSVYIPAETIVEDWKSGMVEWCGAFSSCQNLTNITFAEGIKRIPAGVIAYCPNIRSVHIPSSVTSVGYDAFYSCSSLTSITIPESVTSIEDWAFGGCTSLTSITIPNSVTSIGESAFKYCTSLTSITCEATTPPVLELYVFPSELTTAYIPCGTKSAYEASDWAQYVSEFVEEDCPEPIDPTWQITYTSTDGNIVTPHATDAFGAKIISNTYENGVGTITFDGPVTSIGDLAFYSCTSITSIAIPNGVTSIGQYAFRDCSFLISITIPNSITSIGWGAFQSCTTLTSITIPNNVTSIGKQAFWDCSKLTSITIPDGVTSIGDHAFYRCTSLVSVAIGNSVESIEWGTFLYCFSLTSIIIPNSVTEIRHEAFGGCSFTSITIPNSVTSIGEYAFRSCSLTSITIPNSITSIGYHAFDGCSSLDTIYVEATTPPALGYDALEETSSPICYIPCGTKAAYEASDWAQYVSEFVEEDCVDPTWQITYTSTDGNIVTPDETDVFGANIVSNEYKDGQGVITFDGPVTTIGEQAFHFCQNLASITIPNSVTTIGDLAFNECSSLVSITIPNSVTSIHTFAFADCSSLIEVEIPKSVISIGDSDGIWWACQGIFMGCNNLQKIVVEEGNPIFDSRDNCNAIIETATNTLIAGCPNTEIPNGIKRIGAGAFRECNALGDIDIPSSVNVIGEAAFYGTGITKVVIPSNCIVENSTKGSQRTALFGAFAGCEQLTDIVIPEGTTRIASGMLAGCSSLESLTIPASVTSIGEWAFYDCDALTSITIPDGVTSVEEGTFMRCSKLTSITIPSGVTNIGYYAFGECSLLASVTCEATTPPMLEDLKGSPVFTSSPICYIPCGTKAAYEASDWAQYVSEFVEDCDNGSYSRNVRIGYNTICLPHGSSNFTGATFYEIAHILKNKKKIFFDEVKTLEAGKPYIFYPHSNEVTVYYDNTTSAVPLSHNGLHGTFDGITAASNFLKGKYLVAGDRMVLCGDGCSLAANRAYIELDEISDKDHPAIPGIKRVSMDYSEENATTALDNITDESIVAPMQEGVYDILGRKVDAPTVSGFYIINGKKVFVK